MIFKKERNIETSSKHMYTFYAYKNYHLSEEDEKYVDKRILQYQNKK